MRSSGASPDFDFSVGMSLEHKENKVNKYFAPTAPDHYKTLKYISVLSYSLTRPVWGPIAAG